MTHRPRRSFVVDALARVEGEGGMTIRTRTGRVEGVELRIYEPPRFFEAFLRGRRFTEVPDITARICGICPVAYQMSACRAIEDACGVTVDRPIEDLRRLLYCGEWIESHALHIFFLHAPDFLGYDGMVDMAKDHRDLVERGLRLKKTGNEILATIGGRPVHPVNVRVGGFYRAPARSELDRLVPSLVRARRDAIETAVWTAGLSYPSFKQDYTFVALRSDRGYPIIDGDIVISGRDPIDVHAFEDSFVERQVEHSTALHSRLVDGRTYMVGPMARYAVNSDRLSEHARGAAEEAGLGPVCRNPFESIKVRAVELVYACDEALRLIGEYEEIDPPYIDVAPVASSGCGVTEAPRGILYHRYDVDRDGSINRARIVPPTSQNQARIEQDLTAFVQERMDRSSDDLTRMCEQAIRNYDPCISCATHFLRLDVVAT